MRKLFLGLGVFALIALATSCEKRTFEPEINLPQADTLNITASLKGRVIDEAGQPIVAAKVTVGLTSTSTNSNGEYSFSQVLMNDYAAVVTVEKNGYYNGVKTFMARQSQAHFAEVMLYKLNDMGTVNATTGGLFSTNDGVQVTLPALAFKVSSTGSVYKGNVHFSLISVQPNTHGTNLSGANRGYDFNQSEKFLQYLATVKINYWGDKGEALSFDSGKFAQLTFPFEEVVRPLLSQAQTTKLWQFGNDGFWHETGNASINSSTTYTAKIVSAGTYTAAIDLVGVRYAVTVRDISNNALAYAPIRVKRVYSNTYSYARTDSTGYAQLLVPSDEPLVLEVFGVGGCSSQILYSKNNGPYTAGVVANTGVVNVNTTGTYGYATITGNVVNCVAQPVASGLVHINYGGIAYQAVVTNGSFNLSIPMCKSSDTVSYFAEDYTSSTVTRFANAVIYAGINNNFNSIAVCGNSSISTVAYVLDSLPITDTFKSPIDSIIGLGITNISSPFTRIYAQSSAKYFDMTFDSVYRTGNFAVKSINLFSSKIPGTDTAYASTSVTVSVSEYGKIGGFITGSFNGVVTSLPSNKQHTLVGVFRVRRNF